MKMKSVMEHAFSRVPSADIPRSSFDRSHGFKTTFDADYLIPVFVDEVLPGDTFNLKMTAFARLATPIFPIMDNIFLDSFFFFVPYRLLWDNWERFNGAQDDPGDSTDYVIPQTTAGTAPAGSIADYFGLPTGVAGLEANVLPWRAYYLIFNEWFRDENLQNSVVISKGDGPDNLLAATPAKRGKRHDYFTSCLPWPQKGDSVTLPLGTSAIVKTNATQLISGTQTAAFWRKSDGSSTGMQGNLGAFGTAGANGAPFGPNTTAAATAMTLGIYPDNLYADLTDASSATINELRQAFAIQKLLERDARGGTRYTEIVRSHFGVVSPDARLQRPEYLGGGSSPVSISPVAQTSESAGTPQGNLSAFGTATMHHGFVKSFTEHGVVIGLVNCRADLTYQQGIDRMWSRQTRYDFYWPALSHIGEQAVLSKEIYYDNTAGDDTVFGYQERYAEYRYKPSKVTGLFRSNHAQTLDAWHLSEEFATRPVLDSTFIVSAVPLDRAIAVPAEPHFLFDSYFSLRCARPMPVFGVPGFIDHF